MKATRTLRVFLLVMALVMIFPLAAACNKGGNPTASTEDTASSTEVPTQAESRGPFDPPLIPVDPNASVYSGTPDTSWYSEGKTEFTLTSADQLMGFQELRGQDKSFEGVTIKLGCDMIINKGSAEEIKARGSSNHAWKDLKVENSFKGSFDGQGHTISGVYMQLTSSAYSSMFGSVAGKVSLKNFSITNSYFGAPNAAADKEVFAALITQITEEGTEVSISKVNMEIVMEEAGKKFNKMAGFVGYVDGDVSLKIDNSNFAGKISITGTHVGGFVAHVANATSVISLTTCTNYAELTTAQYCGGMIGQSKSQSMQISECINRGKLNCELNRKPLTGEQVDLYDPYEGAHPAIKEGTTGIRVMSFNVQSSLPKTNGVLENSAKNRVSAVKNEILYYTPDLLGLQEDNWYWIDALKLDSYNVIQDSSNGSSAGSERCAIYYKKGMTLLDSGTHWLTVDGNPNSASFTYAETCDPNSPYYLTDIDRERLLIYDDASIKASKKRYWDESTGQFVDGSTAYNCVTTRKFTYGVFEVNGQILIYANTHLTHSSNGAVYLNEHLKKVRNNARIAEFNHLMKVLTEVEKQYENALIFITGDFNTGKGGVAYEHITKNHGFISAESVTPEHIGPKGSWNNAFNLDKQGDCYPQNAGKENTTTGYLDYCFIENGLNVERFIVGQGRADILDAATGTPKKIYTSDHLPIITDLSFKTATTGKPIVPDDSSNPSEDLSKPSIFNGLPDTSWYTGDKTEYTLTTAEQFMGFLSIRDNGAGKMTFEGVTIKLARDLVINQGTVEEYLKGKPYQIPLISSKYEFRGTFDGQGHTISGIYMQLSTSGAKSMFGGMGNNAAIKNLTLDNCYAGSASKSGKNMMGILSARILGTNVLFSNVKVTNFLMKENIETFPIIGALTGSVDANASLTIENCEVSNGKIDFGTKGSKIGSLVGVVQSGASLTVKSSCAKNVEIIGLNECGGLVGVNSGTTNIDEASTFTGNIVCPGTKGDKIGKS